MNRRYMIAGIIGVTIGLFNIILFSIVPVLEPALKDWIIPLWDLNPNYKQGPVLDLEHQAIALRAAKLFLEKGFWYLSIPTILSCGIAWIDEAGSKNRICWCISKSIYVSTFISVMISIAFAIAGVTHDISTPFWEAQWLYGVCMIWFVLAGAIICGISPALAVLIFLVLLLFRLVDDKRALGKKKIE